MTSGNAVRETRRRGQVSRTLAAALLIIGVVSAIRSLAPQTIGEQVRRDVQRRFSEHYQGLSVSIARGDYQPGVGILLEDVRIRRRPDNQAKLTELIHIQQMYVIADVKPEKLMERNNPIATKRIVLKGVTANLWTNPNGEISLTRLWPPPQFGPACPRIEMHDVSIHVVQPNDATRPIHLQLSQAVLNSKLLPNGTVGKSFRAIGAGDCFQSLRLGAEMQTDAFALGGVLIGARFSHELFERLPPTLKTPLSELSDVELLADAQFACRQRASMPLDFTCRTRVHEGRFSHPRLPFPLINVRGVFTSTPRGTIIEQVHAVLGDAVCQVSGQVHGYRWPADMELTVSANGLSLDSRLASVLPESARRTWNRIQPHGRVDIHAKLEHNDSQWNSAATIDCKGVDISYEAFPYPVQQLVGSIDIHDGVIHSDALDGRAGGRRLRCQFQVPVDPRNDPRRTFAFHMDGPVAIDEALIESLSPRGAADSPLESFVRSLQPRGSVHLASVVLTTNANGIASRNIDLRVSDGTLRYDRFAYPLYNVTGQIHIADSQVLITGFRGAGASTGVVHCDGLYEIANPYQTNSQLDLNFRCANVPMDEALRAALPRSTQVTWDAIAPSGVLDELNVLVSKSGQSPTLGLDITAVQHASDQLTNRTLSLRPPVIPYRLDIAGGVVRYDGSQVLIESLEGRHDHTRVSAAGVCRKGFQGPWQLELDVKTGSRFSPDGELIASLPPTMSESLRRLQLRGPVNVRGKTTVTLPNEMRPEPELGWDLTLQLEGNRIGDVGPVHSLRGEVFVSGSRTAKGILAAGNVRIDSMHVNDLQLTGIRGPFAIEGDRLRFGSLAATRSTPKATDRTAETTPQASPLVRLVQGTDPLSMESTSITGTLFDGQLAMDGELVMTSGDFDISLNAKEMQVPTVLMELGHGNNEMKGTISGQARFDGKLGADDLLKGSGAGRLAGANLYQLPLIVQIFNQLRIAASPDVAFTDGEVEFAIFGDQINLSRLQLWGDLVALDGGGTINRRREVDLSFNTRVSPHSMLTQMLQPLGSRRYTLWTIDVHGPMESPAIQRRALDGVGQTIGRLFPRTNLR